MLVIHPVAHEDALQRMTDGGLIKSRKADELVAIMDTARPAVAAE